MSISTAEFEQIQAELAEGGIESALDCLINQLRDKRKHHELFEALKMKVRSGLELPLTYSQSGDNLDDATRLKLEDGLIDACREVGMGLLADGQVREGWMYLRPVGDRQAAAAQIAKIEIDDDNLEEIVEVTLHEGVDPIRGFGLVLEHYGTCNSITTFESAMHQHPREVQAAAAGMLVEHLHKELLENVRADVARQEGGEPKEQTLAQLVADRDWLFAEGSYHIDTTHLASTVRFARLLSDERLLRLALDLTEYGRRLNEPFQYQGEEPFTDHYPAHALYFQALLGENVEAALDYFRQQAESVDLDQVGTIAVEVYIELLDRIGRSAEAIDVMLAMLPADRRTLGIAPTLFELSRRAGQFQRAAEFYLQHDNLLGYATCLLAEKQASAE